MCVFKDAKFVCLSREIRARFFFFFFFASGIWVAKLFSSRVNFAWKWAWHSSHHYPSHLFPVGKKWMAGMKMGEIFDDFC